jgi:hypothetical protein
MRIKGGVARPVWEKRQDRNEALDSRKDKIFGAIEQTGYYGRSA